MSIVLLLWLLFLSGMVLLCVNDNLSILSKEFSNCEM